MDFIDLGQSKVYVEEPKLRISMRILKRSMRTLKKGKANKQGQPMFKKRSPNQDGASASKEKLGIGSGLKLLSLLVLLVGRDTIGNAYWVPGPALIVVKKDIRGEIVLFLRIGGRKAKQVPPKTSGDDDGKSCISLF